MVNQLKKENSTRFGKVLLIDHPWDGVDIENELCTEAGYELVESPPDASPTELIELASDVQGILTCWAQVTRELIEASPSLAVVGRLGAGVDNIDLVAASERNVIVTRVPDYCVEEVSDHAVGLVFDWARGISFFDRSVRSGKWEPGTRRLRRVRDLAIGVWGAGRIGVRTAEKFAALGCKVYLDDRNPHRAGAFSVLSPNELLGRCDVISLHMPLNEANRNIVNAKALTLMRPDSLLVNTSRGGLVDIDALDRALRAGRPGAVALDVLPEEPFVPRALVGRDDVLLTPHVAFSSDQSIRELRQRATEYLLAVLNGEPANDAIYPTAR